MRINNKCHLFILPHSYFNELTSTLKLKADFVSRRAINQRQYNECICYAYAANALHLMICSMCGSFQHPYVVVVHQLFYYLVQHII